MSGLEGKHAIHSTPSDFRMLAMVSVTFMAVTPLLCDEARPGPCGRWWHYSAFGRVAHTGGGGRFPQPSLRWRTREALRQRRERDTRYTAIQARVKHMTESGAATSVRRNHVDTTKFNRSLPLPFELRLLDFELAMQDIYDFFFDVNTHLLGKGA